jgi:uncharacterized protein YndB with AHSA1/START domain
MKTVAPQPFHTAFAVLAGFCFVVPTVVAGSPTVETVEHTIVIDAPRDAVWEAIATADGLRAWLAPDARVDVEIGGAYEVYFWPENPVGERGIEGTKVLSFVPGRYLSYWGSSPPAFPEIRLKNVAWVTYGLRDLDRGGTEVRMYGSWPAFGEAWETDFRVWVRSAQEIGLGRLAAHLEGRPVDEAGEPEAVSPASSR